MSFRLQIRFVGLLHYIPNSDPERRVRLCVVMPKAEGHRAGIIIPANARGHLTQGGQPFHPLIRLDGKRAAFLFRRAEGGEFGPFDYEDPMLGHDIKGVVPFDVIAPGLADKNPAVVSCTANGNDGVQSQVLLTEGVFSLHSSATPPQVKLPDGTDDVFQLAEKVLMTVENLDSAQVIVSPLEGEGEEVFSIEPDDHEEVTELLVVHLCQPNTDAARRVASLPIVDEDFKFHYRLLERQRTRANKPESEPVPTFLSLSEERLDVFGLFDDGLPAPLLSTAVGCNCAGTGARARPFDLDDFVDTVSPERLSDRP